jgi:hypothetical protein
MTGSKNHRHCRPLAGWQAKACPTLSIEFFMKFRGRNAHPNRPRKAMVCPTFAHTILYNEIFQSARNLIEKEEQS